MQGCCGPILARAVQYARLIGRLFHHLSQFSEFDYISFGLITFMREGLKVEAYFDGLFLTGWVRILIRHSRGEK
jgi:hypothetical protein